MTSWHQANSGVLFDTMDLDLHSGVQVNTSGNGYFSDAQGMLATLSAIIAWLLEFRLYSIAPLVGFVVLRAGTGGRGVFIAALVSVGLLWLYEHRQRMPTPRVIAVLVAVVIAFSAVGSDRGRSIRVLLGTDYTRDREATKKSKFLEGMDFGNLEYFEYLVYAIPQRSHTYDYYLNNFQLFTEPIPRVWWKVSAQPPV